MIPPLATHPGLKPTVSRWLEQLRGSHFSGDIDARFAARIAVASDNSVYEVLPQAVVFPKSRSDVESIMRTLDTPDAHDIHIAPRGGGTGTNGQSLDSGVVVDLSRHMRTIGPLNTTEGTVHVEPGVVLDDLNRFLAAHGYFFAPTLSPSDRATLGGMIATNACGKGSRIYGRTVDHVVELDVVLVDGSLVTIREMEVAEATTAAHLNDRLGHITTTALNLVQREFTTIEDFWPRMPRSPSGYNLRQVLSEDGKRFSLIPLICGSEGTLGIVVGAKLRLTRIPKQKRLLVLRYAQFDDALAAAEQLVQENPAAIETIDENILNLVRSDTLWHRLSHLLADDESTRAMNLVEFVGDSAPELDAKIQDVIHRHGPQSSGRPSPLHCTVPQSPADIDAFWDLRKKGVGLLGKMKGNRQPLPFVEDTAVPPDKLADYVRHFRAILDAEGLRYGMFGHIDVGCLHVRPALDLHDPDDARRLRRISDKVAALAKSYGGVLWGEHGTGFRSEYSPEYFGAHLFRLMCAIKGAFDPTGKLNRGKLALAPNRGHAFQSIDDNHRASLDHAIAPEARQHFAEALLCNGNGQCFSTDPRVVMCPSSKITRDRIHSPKGRAVLMRQWLRQLGGQSAPVADRLANGRYPADFAPIQLVQRWNRGLESEAMQDFSHEVYDALDGCLSCKACATQCPIEVDIPRMKAEFLSLYHERYSRPVHDFLLASLESLLVVLGRFPRLLNLLIGSRVSRWLLSRIAGLVDMPALGLPTVANGLKVRRLRGFDFESLSRLSDDEKSRTVLIVQDAFTTYFEPDVVLATADLLTALDYRPVLVPYFPNGKALHVKGFLRSFGALVHRNVTQLQRMTSLGISLVGLEPAVTLTYRDEYPRALGIAQLPFKVLLLQEWLREQLERIRGTLSTSHYALASTKSYTLLGHCTERTAVPPSQSDWKTVFAAFGLNLKIEDVGCCGMCGVYGHEKAHVAESRGIFSMNWGPRLSQAKAQSENILVSGFSCQHQARRFGDHDGRHPVFALLDAVSNRLPG